MKLRIMLSLILAMSLTLGLTAYSSTPANAKIGGSIGVTCNSLRSVVVTGNWGEKSPRQYVHCGYATYADDDGFYVPSGYDAIATVRTPWLTTHYTRFNSTGWRKVTDGFKVLIRLVRNGGY